MSYDNPSMEELQRFRDALLSRLLFEPVTDPGFVRPADKLHFLIQQSEETLARLQQIVAVYLQLKDAYLQSKELIDGVRSSVLSTLAIDTRHG